MSKYGKTSISEIGEFGLIHRLTSDIKYKQNSLLKGVGDDSAVIATDEDCIVIATDMLAEGIHFNLIYTPLKHLGYKSVVVNISDIYAMNAEPQYILVSIALSEKFSIEAVEELYSGIYHACDKYSLDLIGGDTTSSMTGMIISITAIGRAGKEDIIYRNGAGINDLICVSGDLGGAYMGLQLLEREKKLFSENPKLTPQLEGKDYILRRQLKHEARGDIIHLLKKHKIFPTSMIDISDGLSSEILHICENSNKGCRIYQEKIPLDPATAAMAEEFHLDPVIPALHGGEDYELLFTVPLSEFNKISRINEVSIIGHITEIQGECLLVTSEGQSVPLTSQGWDNLK